MRMGDDMDDFGIEMTLILHVARGEWAFNSTELGAHTAVTGTEPNIGRCTKGKSGKIGNPLSQASEMDTVVQFKSIHHPFPMR